MKRNKCVLGFGLACVLIMTVGAVASRNRYVGQFVGDGASLTNMTAATSIGYTPQPASAGLTNLSLRNASALTNVTTVYTTNTIVSIAPASSAAFAVVGDLVTNQVITTRTP